MVAQDLARLPHSKKVVAHQNTYIRLILQSVPVSFSFSSKCLHLASSLITFP